MLYWNILKTYVLFCKWQLLYLKHYTDFLNATHNVQIQNIEDYGNISKSQKTQYGTFREIVCSKHIKRVSDT